MSDYSNTLTRSILVLGNLLLASIPTLILPVLTLTPIIGRLVTCVHTAVVEKVDLLDRSHRCTPSPLRL